MPAGSVLLMTGVWDNSAANPHNPDPTVDLPYGLASHEEMITGRFTLANATPMGYVVGSDAIPEVALESAARYQRRVSRSTSGQPTNKVTLEGRVTGN